MTRKDYVLIAEAINKTVKEQYQYYSGERNDYIKNAMQKVSESIGQAIKKDNNAFDYPRFMKACGFETEE